MKTMAIIGYVLAALGAGIGAIASFSYGGTGYECAAGIGGGLFLALLSTIVLGIGQIRDAEQRILDVLLFVNDLEFADVRILNESMRNKFYPTDEALIAKGYFRTETVVRKKSTAPPIQKAA
jgi:hypothetical protein